MGISSYNGGSSPFANRPLTPGRIPLTVPHNSSAIPAYAISSDGDSIHFNGKDKYMQKLERRTKGAPTKKEKEKAAAEALDEQKAKTQNAKAQKAKVRAKKQKKASED